MQLVCPCLNVTVNVVAEDGDNFVNDAIVKLESILQLCDDAAVEDDFFSLCSGGNIARFVLDSEKGIVEKLPVLVKRRHVGRWEIRKCILCNADACALGSNCAGQVLVNMKLLLHEESVIAERRKSDEISPIFQVILPKMKDDVAVSTLLETKNTAGSKSGYTNGATTAVSRSALHAVQACVGHYLRKEQELTEERIREFTEQQQAAFDQLKAGAKLEKVKVLSLLAQRGIGTSGGFTSYDSYWSSGSTSLGGVGFGDEEVDSAVPMSPLSLTSGGDPSPGPEVSRVIMDGTVRVPRDMFAVPSRPKAHSNPASLSGWKRKRHSGGPGLAPSLTCHPEEQQQDIFSFEEQENDEINQASYLPADDEGDTTDDSGTGDEYNKYYPPPPPSLGAVGAASQCGQRRTDGAKSMQYCVSLPVRVPQRPSDRRSPKYIDDDRSAGAFEAALEANERGSGEALPKDVGASMQALAKSIKSEDDPERLFGERPQRRRYKTGEDFPLGQPCDPFPVENRRKATVLVLFKEEQNFPK